MEDIRVGGEQNDDDNTTESCNVSLELPTQYQSPQKTKMKPIEGITVPASSTNDNVVMMITESVVGHVDDIAKNCFFNTKGLLNKPRKEDDLLWPTGI